MSILAQIEVRIVDALRPGKPMRRKHLLALAPTAKDRAAVDAAIKRLVEAHAIKRLRYGVYVDANVKGRRANQVEPMSAMPKGPSAVKIIRLLRKPRLQRELREATGISRQGVHKILSRLRAAGKLCRRKLRGSGQFAYVWREDESRSPS